MNREIVCDAIRNMAVLEFTYDGKKRRVEPHIIGYDGDGDLKLSAWQLSGGTAPGWRLFLVSSAAGLATTGERFALARPGYNPHDRAFRQVLARL